ncbi:MAG: hypothetical protein GY943_22835 [Chloroflexi bacterium]|nr:hypothetical protein [Chloroflexota bacterium]
MISPRSISAFQHFSGSAKRWHVEMGVRPFPTQKLYLFWIQGKRKQPDRNALSGAKTGSQANECKRNETAVKRQ